MTPEYLSEVGAALYGARWRAEFARELGVSERTIHYWASGQVPLASSNSVVNAKLELRIDGLIERRIAELEALRRPRDQRIALRRQARD